VNDRNIKKTKVTNKMKKALNLKGGNYNKEMAKILKGKQMKRKRIRKKKQYETRTRVQVLPQTLTLNKRDKIIIVHFD